jgi:hypothetical protein
MNVFYVIRRQRELLAYRRPDAVNPAALIFRIMGGALAAAFAAPGTLSALLGPPPYDLLFLQVPDNPSSNPSV